jgi:phage host-nuclease inhibitor protein Gam
MYFRSTGLGKTQLAGKVVEIKRHGDFLVMHVDTTEPVKWRIRAAMSFRDLAAVIGACMKLAIVSFILSPKQWFNKQPKHIGEF